MHYYFWAIHIRIFYSNWYEYSMKNTPFLHKPVMVLAQEFQSAITQDKAGSAEQSMLSLDYSAPPTNSLWQSHKYQ